MYSLGESLLIHVVREKICSQRKEKNHKHGKMLLKARSTFLGTSLNGPGFITWIKAPGLQRSLYLIRIISHRSSGCVLEEKGKLLKNAIADELA